MAVAESFKRFVFGAEKEDRKSRRGYHEDFEERERVEDFIRSEEYFEDDYEEEYADEYEEEYEERSNDIGSFFKGLFSNRGGRTNHSSRMFREEEPDYEEEEPIRFRETPRREYTERTSYREDNFSSERKNPARIVLVRATGFNEAKRIAENLKQGRSIVVNFEDMEKREAQRLMDFLSGTAFYKDGKVQKLSQSTYIYAVGPVDLVGTIDKAREADEEYFTL